MKRPAQDGTLAITRDSDESDQCLKPWVPCVPQPPSYYIEIASVLLMTAARNMLYV